MAKSPRYIPSTALSRSDSLHSAYVFSDDPSKRLNLRKAPGTQYESLGKYYSSVKVTFLYSLI